MKCKNKQLKNKIIMKIELKNVKINLEFSEETTMFLCDLFVDGKKVAYCKNDGCGGSTNIQPYMNMADKLKEVERYCKRLPKIIFNSGNGIEHSLDMDIELYVDDMIEKIVNEKETKKFNNRLKKDCLKGICYGNENGYKILSWKGYTIETLLKHPQGFSVIEKTLTQVIGNGGNVLNTNIPKELYPKSKQ